MFGVSPHHAVHYFSLVNLKGGLYSIVIGALIYVVIIRGWMMVKMKTGTVVYVNRWPERLDLLELVYYPIVMIILPNVAAFICRCMDFMMDGLILLARKTTHRQLHGGKNPPKGYRVSFWLGGIFNTVTLWHVRYWHHYYSFIFVHGKIRMPEHRNTVFRGCIFV